MQQAGRHDGNVVPCLPAIGDSIQGNIRAGGCAGFGIGFDCTFYRRDIGHRALRPLRT